MAISKKRLEELRKIEDKDIDFSDIPELTEEQLRNLKPCHLYRPTKEHITIRIDSDILDILKSTGSGYQTRINAILRKALIQ